METIKNKIQELLDISSVDLIGDKDFLVKFNTKMKNQERLISELIPLCRAQNTLLGRIIKFPHADSYAFYLITKVNKRNVVITWLNYCDAWVDDRCGKNAYMSIEFATELIRREDAVCKIYN